MKCDSGLAAQALQSRMPFSGTSERMSIPNLLRSLRRSRRRWQVLVLPLLLKEKVAALVYADAGADGGGKMDAAALELLVLATSAWLEVASLRKQALKKERAEAPARRRKRFHAPVAGRSAPIRIPLRRMRPSIHRSSGPLDPRLPATPAVEQQPWLASGRCGPMPVVAAAAAAPAPARPFANLSPEDAEVHRKAQRFARLLVDEIKLYNQAKVSEGRKNRDLYDRLKEDIDKSLATYQKRYGQHCGRRSPTTSARNWFAAWPKTTFPHGRQFSAIMEVRWSFLVGNAILSVITTFFVRPCLCAESRRSSELRSVVDATRPPATKVQHSESNMAQVTAPARKNVVQLSASAPHARRPSLPPPV